MAQERANQDLAGCTKSLWIKSPLSSVHYRTQYQVPVDQEPTVVCSLPHAVPSACGSRARCRLFIIACPYQVPVDQEPPVVCSLPRAVPSPCGSKAPCRLFITACCTKSLWIKSPGCRLLIIPCYTKSLSVDQEPVVVCSLSHAVPSPCGLRARCRLFITTRCTKPL